VLAVGTALPAFAQQVTRPPLVGVLNINTVASNEPIAALLRDALAALDDAKQRLEAASIPIIGAPNIPAAARACFGKPTSDGRRPHLHRAIAAWRRQRASAAACCRRARRSADGHPLPWAGGDHDISLVPYRGDLDVDGVGELIRLAVDRGRAARPGLKVGICGEHGGDPMSIGFCQAIGLDYVSCSEYRSPGPPRRKPCWR